MNLGNNEEMKSKPEFNLKERAYVNQIVTVVRKSIHTGYYVT